MADSTTSWLRRFQPSRAQPQPKQQPQPVITSASEDSFVTSLTTIDSTNGSENLASPLSHPTAVTSSKYHHINGDGIRVVSDSGSGSGNRNGNGSGGTTFGGNATGPIPPPPPPPKTPTTGIFSGTASTTPSLRRPSLPHQKSPSDSNVNGTINNSKLLRSRPSATFQRVSSLLNLGGGGGGNGTTNSPSVTAPSSPSFPSGRPREGSGGSIGTTSRFTFFRPSTPSAAPAPAPSLSALPLSNWSATNGEDEDDYWLGGGGLRMRNNAVASSAGRENSSPWHNPNLMQMAETLQAVMMTKGDSMAALPVQYNSLVHSVLEGFAHLTKRLQALEQELAELKNLREKELEQFRGISEEWIQREDGYKAEIKRLEVVLAKESKDGLASVTLARQDTLIDRSGSKRFQARLKRMSTTADHDRAGESHYDSGIRVVEEHFGDGVNGIRDVSLRNTPMDNDVYVSQLVKRRAAENRGRRRSQLQQSMVPPPSVEETLVEPSSPSSSPPLPKNPYSNGIRSSHSQQPNMNPVKESQSCSSSSTSSSSTTSTVSPEASRSLSQRRNINSLVIETGDVSSTAVNPRQRRIFSYIEGEAEVLTTASDDRQYPFQNYYEFANTFRQQDLEGLSSDMQQPLADTNAHDFPDGTATSIIQPTTAEDIVDRASTTLRPVEEDSTTTSLIGTSSSRSSNFPDLTPSNSTGSVIWVGKRNSRAAGAAAATSTTSSVSEALDQPSYYETSVGGGGENYELRNMTSTATTTTAEAPATSATTNYHYNLTETTTATKTTALTAVTMTATSPRLAPVPSPRAGSTGPAIPPRTTSHQQQQQQSNMKVGSVNPIKDNFEQLLSEQQKQQQLPRTVKEKSPVRKTADKKKMRDKDFKNTSNVSATVAMFNEGTWGDPQH